MAFTEGGGYPSPFSGAIFVDEGTLALTRCKIHSNTVIRAVYNDGFLTLSQCEVQNNTWTQDGAGIYNETAAELHLIQSCLSGNSAGNEGGALYNRPDAIATLVYCTLTGNYADDHGGAILNHGQLNVTHCTISENTGGLTGVGGLLNAIDGTVTLNYSITTGNLGGNVGGPGILSGSHNITTGMPFLSPLGSFGGPTQTMALLPISLALNGATGSNATADQRGLPIIGTPDIGAYEAGHFNSYQTWIWESLPSPSNYTLADRLHAASFDYDGDGQSNGDEWNALTNPANGSRFFAPTSQLIGQTILIRFPSAAGRSYRLDHSETLAPGSWMHSNQQIILGDGNEKTFSTLTPTSARRFFRVVPH